MSDDLEKTVAELTVHLWLSEALSVGTRAEARTQLGRLSGAAAAACLPKLARAARKMRTVLNQDDCDEKFVVASVRRFLTQVAEDAVACQRLAESPRALTWVHPELRERVEKTLIQSIYLSTVLEVDRLIQGSNLDDGELEEAL